MVETQYSAGAFIFVGSGASRKYLILKRKGKGYDLPKGHIEKGESSGVAAIREIMEETSLRVTLVPYFSSTAKYFYFENKKRVLKFVKYFLAESKSAGAKISEEHAGFKWVSEQEFKKLLGYEDMLPLCDAAFSYARKLDEIKSINSEYSALPEKSQGWELSSRFVPGEGPLNAKLMIIGQAPGRVEDAKLKPFVGRSGKLLEAVLRRNKFRRDRIYIMSAVQFFPPENRMPTDQEVELCRPFLYRQLELVDPRYVILLGNLANQVLLGDGAVETNHGKITEKGGRTYLTTFHPAAALRFRDKFPIMVDDVSKVAKLMKASPRPSPRQWRNKAITHNRKGAKK
ncbi:MAG: NUDIX domain-containing protein [Candidatus Micrarchaeota archaeon]|nr:NUDIX domain-containing protein [Candidatus Micrarchaeota archaeon]